MFVSSISSNTDLAKRVGLKSNVSGVNSVQYLPQTDLIRPSISNLQAYHPNISFGKITPGLFKKVAATEANPLWAKLIAREKEFPPKPNELRSPFEIDETRILHSGAYGKMADKTQVFSFSKINTISTRLLHVDQVSSIAESISSFLGLNVWLTRAIAKGHDVGHAPFGHGGESVLNKLIKEKGIDFDYWKEGFYHEKNSLRFLDDIETELKMSGQYENLNLSYAVRDGIISHCGEIDENGIRPRSEYIDLRTIQKGNRPQPFTWEGCVMKISDKIAYLGKDIEDATENKFLNPEKLEKLRLLIKEGTGVEFKEINNSVLINHFISDLVTNSNPHDGLKFSEPTFKMMSIIKKFNYDEIYMPKDKIQAPYYDLHIRNIYDTLELCYKGKDTISELEKLSDTKPVVAGEFKKWLLKYSNADEQARVNKKMAGKVLYDLEKPNDYKISIIEYISNLTDSKAKELAEEIFSY